MGGFKQSAENISPLSTQPIDNNNKTNELSVSVEETKTELTASVSTTSIPVSSVSKDECVPATLTNTYVTLDESIGLQNLLVTPQAGDSDDNDISKSLLPSAFSNRLSALGAGIPIEAALSGYDGISGKNIFNLPDYGAILNMSLSDSSGKLFDGDVSGLFTIGGDPIYLYNDAINSAIVLGKTGDGEIVLAIYLEEINTPVKGGALWTVLYEPLRHEDGSNPDDAVDLKGLVFAKIDSVESEMLDGAIPGQHLFFMGGNGSEGYIVTGREPANQSMGIPINTGDRVNVSMGGGTSSIGLNNQMIDPPAKPGANKNNTFEGLVITFVNDPDPNYTGNNLSQKEADVEANILYGSLRNVDSALFTITQTQPVRAATLQITALNTALEKGTNFIDGLIVNDSKVSVVAVTILDEYGAVIASSDGTVNNPMVSFSFSAGIATVKGVKAGYQVEYETDGLHNRVLIENPGSRESAFNSAFDIGI